jgi:xylulokinase
MSDYLLGIDIGTSGVKCILVDAGGNVVADTSSEYRPTARKPGYSEQDPEEWYRSAATLVRSLLDKKVGVARRIVAVGVTGQMRGLTFIGKSGKPARDSILWNDLRCTMEVGDITKQIPDLIAAVTGNPLNTMCTLPKLLWVMRQEPDVWEKTARIVFPKDYIAFRLTESLQTDQSDASGSSFYDLARREWSHEILDAFSIDAGKLPPIVSSDSVVGMVTEEASTLTGIRKGTPVVAGGSDAVTELLAAGVTAPNQCKIRLGTSGALSTVVDDIQGAAGTGAYLWSYVVPGRYMLDINTRSCAQATAWLRGLLYGDRVEADTLFKDMEAEARTVPLGSDGLVFHPYLMGEDAPYWDPRLRGSFSGIELFHTRGHFIRSVYEGTAFALRDALGALGDVGKGFSEFKVVGGGAKNRLWTSIVLDVLGVDGSVPAYAGAALGAAMLAGAGSGVFRDLAEAVEKCRDTDVSMTYSPDNHNRYMRLFERYRRIKGAFDPIYDIG